MLKKIKNKWGIKSNFQFLIIFIVFGITGSSSVVLGKPILDFFSISPNLFSEIPFGNLLYFILRLIIIFPLYQVLLIIFGLKLRIFPISGVGAMADDATLYVVAMHLILPAVTTAASSLAVVARVTRSAFIDEMGEPYVQAARARGLSQRRIISIETMRNVLPSFVTIAGLQIGFLFSSALFSEIVFNWPGIGLQLYLGIVQRDFPVVQGCVLAIAIVFVVGNLLADILSIALDPRRRG